MILKLYFVASCTFRNTFKVKCPVSDAKNTLFLSKTDQSQSGSVLLRWSLYVSQQYEKLKVPLKDYCSVTFNT